MSPHGQVQSFEPDDPGEQWEVFTTPLELRVINLKRLDTNPLVVYLWSKQVPET